MANEERCEELREALSALRADMTPPMQDAVLVGATGVIVAGEVNTAPQDNDSDNDLDKQIEALEQALRDEGCEPE